MGLTFGPMGALLPELFPTNVRYTGSAISYNVASILGASIAPIVAVLLWQRDGDILLVGLYLTGAAVVTFVALLLSRRPARSTWSRPSLLEATVAPCTVHLEEFWSGEVAPELLNDEGVNPG